MAKDITFIVPGQSQAASPAALGLRGQVSASVRVGARRGVGDSVRLVARPGEDVVVLSITNGPTLVLHPQDARDLMRAQAVPGTRAATDDGDAVSVPAQLGWPGLEAGASQGATRGWMGQVLLGAIDVIKGLVVDHGVTIVSALATKKLDGRVEAGVYELSASELQPLKGSGRKRDSVNAAADGGPMLVMVHGTFVDTVSTFGKLWTLHPGVVARLFAHYGGRVYALTALRAPLGLRDRVELRWYRDSVLAAVSAGHTVSGGRSEGFRLWSAIDLQRIVGARVLRLDVVTEGGQLVGRSELRAPR